MFKHFLVTRFNVRIDTWETTKNGELLLDDSWMEDRFSLFETYCLPSVVNQSNQNFTWCIFFDTTTNEKYRPRIKRIEESYTNIDVLFINGNNELKSSLIKFIRQHPDDNLEFVITSRLDTDDLLHRDYIKTVQQLFKPSHNTLIDVRSGYEISIEDGSSSIRNFYNSFNPFISLIERRETAGTVFNKMHKDWVNTSNIIVYDQVQLWIELVHKKNKINTTIPDLKYSLRFKGEEFGIDRKIVLKKNVKFYFRFCKWKIIGSFLLLKKSIKNLLRM